MSIRKGDMFYIQWEATSGSEQMAGRPGIIVSNNKNNEFSDVVEVVYLTTAPKRDLPTHVVIRSAPKVSTAPCEQITSVSTSRLGSYIGSITEREMRQVDSAMLISLDLWLPAEDEEEDGGMEETQHCICCDEGDTESRDGSRDLTAAITERDVYRKLYEQLLDKVVAG